MQIADALRLAIQHFNAGRAVDGTDICARILDLHPANPAANVLLARQALRDGDRATARRHVDTALAEAADYPAAHELDARLKAEDETADPNTAERAYRRTLTLAPGQWAPWYDGGNLHQARRDDPAAAVPFYRRALTLAPDEIPPAMNLATAQLKLGDAEAALNACAHTRARDPNHIRALALETAALYDLGRADEADRLVGWGGLTRAVELPQPDGYPDIAAFNHAFAAAIRRHPNRRDDWDPSKRAIRGGAVVTDLLAMDDPAIRGFGRALDSALRAYVRALPADAEHPHVAATPARWALDVWANILGADDHQTGHIHNLGWLSGVYYVAMPGGVRADDPEQQGWIEFNRPGYGIPHRGGATLRTLFPAAGMAALFPSYVWHRTIPFTGTGERISVAFDLHPR
ncbi:MAG: tetratricopeptide repeat protein [Alphaproteobacteria bacterium]|nr:tetratricopeptide repeat protein [Alphaproteobacteria bacterium]